MTDTPHTPDEKTPPASTPAPIPLTYQVPFPVHPDPLIRQNLRYCLQTVRSECIISCATLIVLALAHIAPVVRRRGHVPHPLFWAGTFAILLGCSVLLLLLVCVSDRTELHAFPRYRRFARLALLIAAATLISAYFLQTRAHVWYFDDLSALAGGILLMLYLFLAFKLICLFNSLRDLQYRLDRL